jgi:hypothetical protein
LHGEFTSRFTKGSKNDSSKNKIIVLDSLDTSEFNIVNPLKLLLIQAVRQGGVKGATMVKEAITNALNHPRGLLKWAFPQRPIMVGLPNGRMDFARGARACQLLNTLNEAAILSRIIERLSTHDVRRGSAAAARKSKKVRNYDAAAESLGHTEKAKMRGVTNAYMGHLKESDFADRIAEDHVRYAYCKN